MTRMPGQPRRPERAARPGEADDLVDLLLETATVIHALAGVPAAEAAAAQAVTGGRVSCQDLVIDLQLAAAGIEEQAAGRHGRLLGKEEQVTTPANAAGKNPRGMPQKTAETG